MRYRRSLIFHGHSVFFIIVIYFFYIILTFFFLIPILWVISLSLKERTEVLQPVQSLFDLVPEKPTIANYQQVLAGELPIFVFNSFKLVIMSVFGVLLISSLSAFALSRSEYRHKNFLQLIILFFQMVSPVVLGIPLYFYYSKLGILNNYITLGLVYIAVQLSFSTFLLKGIFDSVPKELDESAYMDGASRIQVLFRIILPCSISGIASATIFISINSWSNFILPFYMINKSEYYPVSVGLTLLQGSHKDISTHILAAGSVIGLFPAMLLVLLMQKFIVKALMAGAIKG